MVHGGEFFDKIRNDEDWQVVRRRLTEAHALGTFDEVIRALAGGGGGS